MKVTAFIGSAQKQHTYHATEQFLRNLQSLGNVDYEIVRLSEYNLQICKGCKLCTDKGEEFCPLNDDRDKLVEKMAQSDGVVFATPNYAFQVSGLMKVFLDRFNPYLHRPQFFGKAFTSIVAQGVYGGNKIVKYINFIGSGLGFNVVDGSCITTLEPMTEKARQKIDRTLEKHSVKYYSRLIKSDYPSPSLFKLMAFRWGRTAIKEMLNENFRDYTHYRDKGWFESNYYYPVQLSPFKKLTGGLFDRIARRTTRK